MASSVPTSLCLRLVDHRSPCPSLTTLVMRRDSEPPARPGAGNRPRGRFKLSFTLKLLAALLEEDGPGSPSRLGYDSESRAQSDDMLQVMMRIRVPIVAVTVSRRRLAVLTSIMLIPRWHGYPSPP
jgi:hypothetical protein